MTQMSLQGPKVVAAVQFEPKILDVRKNISTARDLAFEAAAKGACVVVLPELCVSGYALKDAREASACAQTRDGYQTQAFLEIARVHNCHIVLGYVELLDGKLYNSAAVLGPRGLVSNHQKHNLWANDHLWAEASEAVNPVVVTRAGRLGTLICGDVENNYRKSYKFYNEGHRFYRHGSVDAIALLTNWSGEFGYPHSSWVSLAEQVNTNVIVSNRVGKERELKFGGGSCVVTRSQKVYTNGSSFVNEAVVGGIVEL